MPTARSIHKRPPGRNRDHTALLEKASIGAGGDDYADNVQEQLDKEFARQAGWKSLFNFTTKQHTAPLVIAVSLSVFAGLVVPTEAFLLGKLFAAFASYGGGTITQSKFMDTVSRYCVYLVALGSAAWALQGGYFTSWMIFGELQAKSARDRLFNGLIERDMGWYDMRKNGIGALATRLQMQIQELRIATSQPLGTTIECLATTVASFAMAMYFSWKLTLVILATVPLIVVVMGVLSAKMQPNIDAQHEKLSEAAKHSNSAFSAIEMVKCFNGQDSELWKYSRAVKEAAQFYIRQTRWNAGQASFMRLSTLGMFVQGFWYGSTLLDSGKMDAGKILTCFWAALMATGGLTQIVPLLIVLEKGRLAGAKLRAVMAEVQKGGKDSRETGCKVPTRCTGDIEFKNVSFAYPTRPDQFALRKATLFFPAGEMTFVVGRSGSGKSTLGQLLMRFYNPSSGRISLDGNLVESLAIDWLRTNVTLVEQQSVLFEGTVFQNIALGRQDYHNVTLDEVKGAAELAIVQHMINDMPQGLETMVGAKGNSMSGGQRQRMALARARLRDTPILILDESTSALDYITRSLVMDGIRHWRQGKTTIIITHDISQVLPEDYAFILEQGVVVQEGYRRSMEEDAGSPFQAFLVPDAESSDEKPNAVVVPNIVFDDPRSTDQQSQGSSAEPEHDDYVDPLDFYLDERGAAAMSYIPTVFTNRLGVPSNRDSQRLPTVVSPFWRVMPTTGNLAAITPSPVSSDPGFSENEFDRSDRFRPRSVIISDAFVESMEKMMDRTERLASGALSRPGSVRYSKGVDDSPDPLPAVPPQRRRQRLGRDRHDQNSAEEGEADQLKDIMKTVWPALTWKPRILLVIAFLAAIVHAVATPVFSFVFSKLLTTFYIKENRVRKATVYSLAVLAVAVGDALASMIMSSQLEYCGQTWVNGIRMEAMKRVLDQPRDFFDKEQNSVSRLADTLDHHAEEMRNLLGRFTGFVFVAILMMATAVVWSLESCWKLTLVGLATAPFLYTLATSFETMTAKMDNRSHNAAEAAGAIFTETFTNIKTVRSLTLESYFRAKYVKTTVHALRIGLRKAIYCGAFFGLTDSAIAFVTALIFYYGAVLVSSHQFNTEHILTVFTQLTFGMTTVNSIISFIPQMSTARESATRLRRLANLPQTSHEHTGNARIPSVGDITLNRLSFAYPSRPSQPILRDINLSIPSGSCTAIVGASGSGKSTIAALLLNLYTTGPIRLDAAPDLTLSGRDIKRIHTPTLRALITVVAQTPTLFPASIAENITYGLRRSSPHNNRMATCAAAEAAGVHEFIASLPQGYDTVVGEGGAGLSGGQAQRIAVARALVRQPDVLILDEATSALDVESAGVVRDSVRELVAVDRRGGAGAKGRGMTVIIITHSRAMMAVAENIVMLDQGRVVEQGGFDELLRRRGPFARLLSGGRWDAEAEVARRESLRLAKGTREVVVEQRATGKTKDSQP